MRRFVLALAILLAAHVASAQPALTPPSAEPDLAPPGLTPPSLTPAATPAPMVERKNPTTAVLLSLGITTASYLTLFKADDEGLQMLGFAGTYLGPSTGIWYAGKSGGLGLGLRAVGFVSMVYGITQIIDAECEDFCSGSDESGGLGGLFLLGGAGLWIGSSIYDIVLAKRAADSWNTRHGLNVAPITTSDASGRRSTGLVLTGRF